MKPSQTTAGRRWLTNFEGADLPAATILIDSLRYVSLSAIWQGLSSRLAQLGREGKVDRPAVVFPERSMADFGVPSDRRDSAVAYVDFDPGDPVGILSGSEGLMAMIIRDLPGMNSAKGSKEAVWLRPDIGLEGMRERRTRSVVVVTDYMGTGGQVLRFVRALGRNRTIRSWLSFEWIDIHVVAFAASPLALERVSVEKDVSGVWMVEAAPTFATAPWEPGVREAIVDLCERKCGLRDSWAVGYEGSAGLFLTERGAPNNLPAIMWQSPPGWTPLFGDRAVPPEFARQIGDYRLRESLEDLAERSGQLRLGRNQRLANMREASRAALKMLILLAEGRRNVAVLAAQLGIDISDAEIFFGLLERLEWVDRAGTITEAGRAEIAANRRGLRRTTANLTGSADPYYPHSLR